MPKTENLKDLNIAWAPYPGPQTFALQVDRVRELLFGGSRGPGKTDGGIAWLTEKPYIAHPAYRALVIRRNVEDLKDWVDRAGRMYARSIAGFVQTKHPTEMRFPKGGIIRIGHLKDAQAYTKYIGHEYHKILIEELTLIPRELDYLQLISSCRSTIPELQARVFCTTNPGGPGHGWVKKRWQCGKSGLKPMIPYQYNDGVRCFVPGTVDDNPAITEEYKAFLNALPEPLRSAWRDGDWDVFVGQLFNIGEYHIIDPLDVPESAPLYMGFDWGYGKPYSVGWYWVDPDGRLYRFGELYGCIPGMEDTGLRQPDEEIAANIIDIEHELGINNRNIIRLCDPTCFNKKPDYKGGGQGPSTAEVFARMGISMIAGDPSRALKFREVISRFHIRRNKAGEVDERPMVQIYKTCTEFIRTMSVLQADEDSQSDVDTDMEDHCYDEFGLVCMARPKGIIAPGEQRRRKNKWFKKRGE